MYCDSLKISARLFTNIDYFVLRFISKGTGPKISNTILTQELKWAETLYPIVKLTITK